MSKEAKEAVGKLTEWMPIDENNLPSVQLICQWKHPKYGIVTGSLVRYGGRLESEKAWWVFPVGGSEADIWLGEFVQYRKYLPKQQNDTNVPLIADVVKAAQERADMMFEVFGCTKEIHDASVKYANDNWAGTDRKTTASEGFIAGSQYERSKLPELIKEVLKRAADGALMKFHCGTFKTDSPTQYHQVGADNIQIDKQSILNVNCDDLIK